MHTGTIESLWHAVQDFFVGLSRGMDLSAIWLIGVKGHLRGPVSEFGISPDRLEIENWKIGKLENWKVGN